MGHFCGVPMTAASVVVRTLCRDSSPRIRQMLAILEHAIISTEASMGRYDALSHSSQLIKSCVLTIFFILNANAVIASLMDVNCNT